MDENTSAYKKILIGKRDAAIALGLSIRSIENYIRSKELTARRVGRRTLVLASSLEAFARKDHPSPSPAARRSGSLAKTVK